MELILNNNLFSFHEGVFRQDIGGAMGSPPIPSYANNFMSRKIDDKIKIIATQGQLKFLKRFLDDLFLIFKGTTKELHTFFDKINRMNESIKFTMTHTAREGESESDRCSCKQVKEISFLDTLCSIEKGKI